MSRSLRKTRTWEENAFFEIGIKEINIRTIAVVDEITLYLMIFGLLFGEIKKEGFIPLC